MAERMTILDGEKLIYKGLFEFKEFFAVIDAFLWQKGFDKRVKKNEVKVLQDYRDTSIVMSPWKKVSEHVKHEIKMDISIKHGKEEVREIDGLSKKLINGIVEIKFYGYLVTDFEGRWEQRPEYSFIRIIMDKWIYKIPNQNKAGELKENIRMLKSEIEAFLNLHRFT